MTTTTKSINYHDFATDAAIHVEECTDLEKHIVKSDCETLSNIMLDAMTEEKYVTQQESGSDYESVDDQHDTPVPGGDENAAASDASPQNDMNQHHSSVHQSQIN